MAPSVHIVCRNYKEDRVIPRMARLLSSRLGWTLGVEPSSGVDAVYLSAYFEIQKLKSWPSVPVAAYFTHREETPPNGSKARLFDDMAAKVDLRIATCRKYAEILSQYGPTVQVAAPLERDRFVVTERVLGNKPVVGFSGYTYKNHRKGEDLAKGLVEDIGSRVEWRASGRGWPVPTRRYKWADMPKFYQGLDVLVCTSLVEGIPMPPLEALSCGISVVVPRGVGLLDELPDVEGIHRYDCGDYKTLLMAVEDALDGSPDRNRLRDATLPYSEEQWCEDHVRAFDALLGGAVVDAGIDVVDVLGSEEVVMSSDKATLVERGTGSSRGIYCVAFGDPARECAKRMMASVKKFMPDIPICLCASGKIGIEDVLIVEPDSDIGGRRAKLKAYELAPAEWESVLYLDADTEVVAPIYQYFQWIESGWEFVICKDPHLMDTMHAFERRNNRKELEDVKRAVRTLHTLQYNGGVWAFGRNDRVERFFRRWQAEWEVHAQRDQGALIRAMYAEPLKVLLLGNEWNTFPKYTKGIKTAGLMHYPGDARRWSGMIPGRIDSDVAWQAVERFEASRRGRHG